MVATNTAERSRPLAENESAGKYEADSTGIIVRVDAYDLHVLDDGGDPTQKKEEQPKTEKQRADITVKFGVPVFQQLHSGIGPDPIEAFDCALVSALRRILRQPDLQSQLDGYSHSVCRPSRKAPVSCVVKIISINDQPETGSGERLSHTVIKTLALMYNKYLADQRVVIVVV